MLLVPLDGACVAICGGKTQGPARRSAPLSAVMDLTFFPPDAATVLSSTRGEGSAFRGARAQGRVECYYQSASQVPVEVRRVGSYSWQVNNLLPPLDPPELGIEFHQKLPEPSAQAELSPIAMLDDDLLLGV